MTVREMSALIGRSALLYVGDLAVEVRVTDARTRFGSVDVQVTPVSGHGLRWVLVETVSLIPVQL
jgi:hypothetical protein